MLATRVRWAVTMLGLLAAGPAGAHEFYARECCSDHDCRPAESGEVVAEPGGWRILPTGEYIPQWATRRAPDGRIHRCTKDGDPHALTICLYVPDPGSCGQRARPWTRSTWLALSSCASASSASILRFSPGERFASARSTSSPKGGGELVGLSASSGRDGSGSDFGWDFGSVMASSLSFQNAEDGGGFSP
jgi:hypothetical protein